MRGLLPPMLFQAVTGLFRRRLIRPFGSQWAKHLAVVDGDGDIQVYVGARVNTFELASMPTNLESYYRN